MKKILKWIGIVLGSLIGLILVAGVLLYFIGNARLNKTYNIPPSNLTLPKDAASLEYGKHRAETLCQGCHGPDLSGVDNWFNAAPIGTIDSANLTAGVADIINFNAPTLSQGIRAHLLAHPAIVPFALQQPGLGPHELRLGEAIFKVLRPAGFSDAGVVGTVYALLSYILGFVALEVSRANTDPPTSDDFVRRLRAFFTALPVAEFPQHVELAPLLAPFSADD
ncbi:MAG: TetR/AcrR family transcriptional regulator C-terminal domain-containing protein, partial [Chloroflexota bacterium]